VPVIEHVSVDSTEEWRNLVLVGLAEPKSANGQGFSKEVIQWCFSVVLIL